MKDQADSLRKMRRKPSSPPRQPMKRIAITSGKGGVGKTNLVINLALALKQRGKRVTIFDADLGLANIDILLGLSPENNISHLLNRNASLEEILVEGPQGIQIIPAGSGIQELTHLDSLGEQHLLEELAKVDSFTDVLLIDTAAGISDTVISFLLSSDEILLVTNPEPTSIVDAYAVAKVIGQYDGEKSIRLVVNGVSGVEQAQGVFRQIDNATRRFLGKSLHFLGFLPQDEALRSAVSQQRAVLELYPESPVSKAFQVLSKALLYHIDRSSTSPRGEDDSYNPWKEILK